jgi:hypothetical protein
VVNKEKTGEAATEEMDRRYYRLDITLAELSDNIFMQPSSPPPFSSSSSIGIDMVRVAAAC